LLCSFAPLTVLIMQTCIEIETSGRRMTKYDSLDQAGSELGDTMETEMQQLAAWCDQEFGFDQVSSSDCLETHECLRHECLL
jgi:hypothetical protein